MFAAEWNYDVLLWKLKAVIASAESEEIGCAMLLEHMQWNAPVVLKIHIQVAQNEVYYIHILTV
jgi:hypothetical protein